VIIFPDIEIQNGKCVNLVRGQMDTPKIYPITPLDAALLCCKGGAEWLHVIDLDAVAGKTENNRGLILEIMSYVPDNVNVQVGGGIQSMHAIDEWIADGAARVVLGRVAVTNPTLVTEAANRYPGQIVVSIDARAGKVVIDAWEKETAFEPLALAKLYEKAGVAAIIYTDIDHDNEQPEASFAQTIEICAALDTSVISSGLVRTLDDISTLKHLRGIAGVVTGRALLGQVFTIEEALEVARMPLTFAPMQ
jgi:phosphoribosylformimino-5-aminoimidazole carboxamide ribotide isomerase